MIAWLAVAAQASGVCADNAVAAVEDAITSLRSAYETVDESAFDRATKNLDAAVACLDEIPPPSTVARLHQAEALASFVSGRTKATRRSLIAARLIDPGWKLDEDAFPEGHPYRELWKQAADPGPVEPIGRIAPDVWIVDGYERDEAPTERAFLLQVRDRSDAITWSGYLWTFEEIPDRGQNAQIDPNVTPRTLSISMLGIGRALMASQRADVTHGWQDQQATALGGGLAGVVRYTPSSLFGLEGSVAGLTPDNALTAQGLGPETQAVVLLGSALAVGRRQVHAAARLGVGSGTLRAWPEGDDGAISRSWTIVGPSMGVEAGLRSTRNEVALAADYLLAGGTVPYQLRARLGGAVAVSGGVAVQGGLVLHQGGLPFADDTGVTIGRRSDLDVRAVAGIALWR